MSDLFALQGRGHRGKTGTLNDLIRLLSSKYNNAQVNIIINGNDKKVIFKNIKGLTIGIETQGDPNSRLQQSLSDFSNAKCDIIFCACRTRGMTVDWVNSLSNKYKIHFVKQTIVNNNFQTRNMNKATNLMRLSGL